MGPGSPHLTGPPGSRQMSKAMSTVRAVAKNDWGQSKREVSNRIIRLLPCEILVRCFWFLVGTVGFLVGTFGFLVGTVGFLAGSLWDPCKGHRKFGTELLGSPKRSDFEFGPRIITKRRLPEDAGNPQIRFRNMIQETTMERQAPRK